MNHFSWKMTIKENEIFREIIDCEVELNSSEMQPVKAIFIEGILEPERVFSRFSTKATFFLCTFNASILFFQRKDAKTKDNRL